MSLLNFPSRVPSLLTANTNNAPYISNEYSMPLSGLLDIRKYYQSLLGAIPQQRQDINTIQDPRQIWQQLHSQPQQSQVREFSMPMGGLGGGLGAFQQIFAALNPDAATQNQLTI